MNDYDIVVVGAGPGGSIAAKTAAEKGYNTCLLEKEEISVDGRYKACGGAIAKELFEEIDYPEEKLSRTFESLELHHTNGVILSKKGEGAVIWRNVFDKFLTDMAIESGATLKEKEPLVQIEKLDDTYQISTSNLLYIENLKLALFFR
jgi:flavin-dependent dehydrogenase